MTKLGESKKRVITIIIIILIMIIIPIIKNLYFKIYYPQKYSSIIEKYSIEYGVEKELIYAVIKAESKFDEKAISNKDAIGLMQLLESTAQEVAHIINIEVTAEQLLEPDINIKIGTKYISMLIERYKNNQLALAAYNAGIGNVDRWIEEGKIKADGTNIENVPYRETNNYIRKVTRDYKIYVKLFS